MQLFVMIAVGAEQRRTEWVIEVNRSSKPARIVFMSLDIGSSLCVTVKHTAPETWTHRSEVVESVVLRLPCVCER
jgi:ribosomal protein L14